MIFDVISEAMDEDAKRVQRQYDLWLRQRLALTHAKGEIATIAVVARHSWAWSVLGVNQWCERRRSS